MMINMLVSGNMTNTPPLSDVPGSPSPLVTPRQMTRGGGGSGTRPLVTVSSHGELANKAALETAIPDPRPRSIGVTLMQELQTNSSSTLGNGICWSGSGD